MNVSRFESEPPEDRDDLVLLLDEELSRLPERYRAALVACELEGKSRREAAEQLGIPEGTLSTHLARGRKLLRERLLRRGVTLGVGPIAGLSPPFLEPAIPERLMEPTVRAAMGYAPGCGTAGTISTDGLIAGGKGDQDDVPREADLARRRLLDGLNVRSRPSCSHGPHRLSLLRSPIRPGRGRMTWPAGSSTRPGRPWPTSRSGRSDGRWFEPVTVATATTDRQGRYVLPGAWAPQRPRRAFGDERLGLFARARDGRVGWLTRIMGRAATRQAGRRDRAPAGRRRPGPGDRSRRPPDRGRRGRAGEFWTPTETGFSDLTRRWSPKRPRLTDPHRRGWLVRAPGHPPGLAGGGHDHGPRVRLAAGSPGTRPRRSSSRSISASDGSRAGSSRRTHAGSRAHQCLRQVRRTARQVGTRSRRRSSCNLGHCEASRTARSSSTACRRAVTWSVPTSRRTPIHRRKPSRPSVEVGPGGVATVEIPLERLATITGRVIDARTGKGVAGHLPWNPATRHGRNMVVKEMRTPDRCRGAILGPGASRARSRSRPGTAEVVSRPDAPRNIPTSRSRPTGPCPT